MSDGWDGGGSFSEAEQYWDERHAKDDHGRYPAQPIPTEVQDLQRQLAESQALLKRTTESLLEMRDACAACFRVIATEAGLAGCLDVEFTEADVKDGFGKRADEILRANLSGKYDALSAALAAAREDERGRAGKILSQASKFDIEGEGHELVTVERRSHGWHFATGMGKVIDNCDHWSINKSGFCLNRDLEWEYEPLPSSREEEFIKRTRWNSAQEAIDFYEAIRRSAGEGGANGA